MNDATKHFNYGPLVFFGLVMALGPLTALSLGSRYADEETLARANAGLESYEPANPLAAYGVSGESAATPDYASDRTLADVLASSGVFDEFASALERAGLEDKLVTGDHYTVFAPSDEAFAKLAEQDRALLASNPQALASLIGKHIVPGRYTATDLMQMSEARSLQGERLSVGASARYNGHVGVGGAEIVKTNLFASNGIVHVVDSVIR
jgi:uncharacterized surface protein with fasciclin (FAS1) repeats